jgi:hypothetical protein
VKFSNIAVAAVIVITALASCKKEKMITPVAIHKNYEGQWNNVLPPSAANSLDFINLTINLVAGDTGTVESKYISTGQVYPQTNLSWKKIAGDSVVITLNLPAYPADTWELRGIANESSTTIVSNCYYIPNNDLSSKSKMGNIILNRQ